jgi:hypothetical protein
MLFEPPEAEPPAPLLPSTSISRPPASQTRAVLVVMVGFVLVLCVLAYFGLRSFGSGGDTPTNQAPPSGSSSKTSAPSTSAGGTATAPAGAALRITKASGFDPQGDGSEKDNLAKLAFDSKASSGWTSDTYRSPAWGGLKKGVGLRLDLGSEQTVHSATLKIGGTGAAIQVLAVNGDTLAGSTVLAKKSAAAGTFSLTFAQPATTRYVVIWFSTPGQFSDGYRAEVDDVKLR